MYYRTLSKLLVFIACLFKENSKYNIINVKTIHATSTTQLFHKEQNTHNGSVRTRLHHWQLSSNPLPVNGPLVASTDRLHSQPRSTDPGTQRANSPISQSWCIYRETLWKREYRHDGVRWR